MLESKQILAYDDPSKTFLGVSFILLGFDSVKEDKVRSKLLEGGGVDAVNYGPDCNHVIVDKLVYDDPICVSARRDGKVLVTGLWVDHSFDVGMPVDPNSVMYRPMRDLNGIPGAKSLVVCLTGYQRQDRDDIMTMVALMGANFSKPLVANKVTHLICYKFEGEKFELAKKMKKIKLVNHRWLEDCLKAWELLPEADYVKSGYELEMEAEARDSEEETEDVASLINMGRKNVVSPLIPRAENKSSHQSPITQEVSRNILSVSASKSLANVGETSKIQLTPGKMIDFEKSSFPQETHDKQLEMATFCSSRSPGKMSSVPSNRRDGKVFTEKVENVLASASENAKKSPSAEVSKLSSKSNSRSTPLKASLPLTSERIESDSGSPSTSNVNKLSGGSGSHMPSERHKNGTDFDGLKTPLEGTLSHLDKGKSVTLPYKRKKIGSRGSSKSLTLNPDSKTLMQSELLTKTTEVPASGFSIDGSHGLLAGNVSPTTIACLLRNEASLAPKEGLSISVASEDRQECNDQVPQSSHEGVGKKTSSSLDVRNLSPIRTDYSGEVEMHQSDPPSIEPPSTKSGVEKMDDQADLNSANVGQTGTQVKPLKRKMLAKKTLGSRPTMLKTTKHKGSNNLQKAVLQNQSLIHTNEAVTREGSDNSTVTEKVMMAPPNTNEDGLVDDETKVPDDNWRNEFDSGSNKEKSAEVEALHSREDVNHHIEKQQADGKIIPVNEQVKKSKNSAEAEKAISSKKIEPTESKSTGNAEEQKLTKGKKRPLTKSKTTKLKEHREDAEKDGSKSKQKGKKMVSGTEEGVVLAGGTKTKPSKKLKSSSDVEKENKPVTIRQQSVSNDTGVAKKVASQILTKSVKNDSKADKVSPSSMGIQNVEAKTEPAWFILSGHRLQRKEFQQVIRRLKGRVCRDSHHWSYQATHFIVPDPIRRTEKFFAAAASGSWILKTDYLTASNEAGRFLSEEPYEWHKKCLTEDGAINLEAPRKWRLLRERTGHGAFYGMKIVIYGECIAPPLDTLKRVVKAGDGTILATSPPYTRFFKSRIDFAIVSPGMPRVDMWVQEFLRHEVPCVVADYLVEYVCKPGYSLERHVQYNTHAWAKKSLENLINRVEEVVEDPRTPDHSLDDVACKVCGSHDRGDEMLICGNEDGSLGCGVGIHIDCLDPPLEDVPSEDWFCPDCSQKVESKTTSRSSKKRGPKSKK
ncbi:BRCT domain-containing protein [Sesamum alatum]|uniref:BRCT domain-containing protein n=1 Tax=Sesamum alatum TaxID=300844 RepID=A0AAE2CDF4_9LAMI|nr:BRCT domain-containing protein [Sesamum alatum]